MSQTDTKESILDQAEALFAEHGYRGTSLRQITAAAHVNLAAVSYHFGSKEGLVAAVIGRRIVPLNEQRCQKVEEVLARAAVEDRRPEVREVLRAFVEPTLLLQESAPGAKNFVTLVGRAMADTDETARRIFIHNMTPALQLFYKALGLALPEMKPEVLYWRVNFVIGALSHTMRCVDKCPMALKEAVPRNARQLVDLLLPFLTAGVQAP